MHELRAGLWHWQAPHPEWTPNQRWPQQVSSCAIDDGERLLLFDPLAVPEALLVLAEEREPVIMLTTPWHERDAQALVERLDAALFFPPPDTAQDLIDKYGITPEQAGDGSPDLRWLRSGGGTAHWYADGDRLPFGIKAYAGREHNDLVLSIERVRTVVAGDSLVGFGTGLALNEWLRGASPASRSASGCGHCSRCRSSSCSRRTGPGRPCCARTRARLTAVVHVAARMGFEQPVMAAHAT